MRIETPDGQPLTGQNDLYASASRDAQTGTTVLKIVNTAHHPSSIAIRFNGSRRHPSQGVCTFLQADDLNVVNDFDQERIAPHTMPVRVDADGVLRMELPANFFGVFELH